MCEGHTRQQGGERGGGGIALRMWGCVCSPRSVAVQPFHEPSPLHQPPGPELHEEGRGCSLLPVGGLSGRGSQEPPTIPAASPAASQVLEGPGQARGGRWACLPAQARGCGQHPAHHNGAFSRARPHRRDSKLSSAGAINVKWPTADAAEPAVGRSPRPLEAGLPAPVLPRPLGPWREVPGPGKARLGAGQTGAHGQASAPPHPPQRVSLFYVIFSELCASVGLIPAWGGPRSQLQTHLELPWPW